MHCPRTIWLCLTGLVASSVGAAASNNEIQLDYDAPIGCPTRDEFTQQLLGRSRYSDAMKHARVSVRVVRSGATYRATLVLVDASGNRVEREISGPSCHDGIAAIALVAAVTMDGSANLSGTLSAPLADASPVSESVTVPVPAPTVAEGVKDRAPLEVAQPSSTQKPKPRPARSRFSIGIVGGVHGDIAPYVTPTAAISGNYHPRFVWGSPEYRLALAFGSSIKSKTIRFGPDAADDVGFQWAASRIAACPFRLRTIGGSMLGTCALLEIGALRGYSATGSSTGLWLAPGYLLDWSLLTAPFRWRLAAGTAFPIVRDHFMFRSGEEVHQPGQVGFLAEVEAGWSFD